MEVSTDSEFHFTKQTGDEASAALSRMTDVDVIVELEGGSIKFGTDQGEYCPISTSYRAVRYVAAAKALAGNRPRGAVFALVYDDRNPYFRGPATGRAGPRS